jgi:hypothetical protein
MCRVLAMQWLLSVHKNYFAEQSTIVGRSINYFFVIMLCTRSTSVNIIGPQHLFVVVIIRNFFHTNTVLVWNFRKGTKTADTQNKRVPSLAYLKKIRFTYNLNSVMETICFVSLFI